MTTPAGRTAGAGEQLAAHLVTAVMAHVQQLHRDGRPVPPGLVDLARMLATARHFPPELDGAPSRVDRDHVPPLTVDYAAAAAALDVSVRTVSRLVADGALPVVGVGRGRRIPAAALTAYATQESP